MAIRHSITLSTTEPNNEVGNLKIRQGDEQTQTLVVQITENGIAKPFTGLQPFFCAKLGQTAGLGIVEQKVTGTMNPANGTLEYVMQPEDWQQIGRQTGYFSFRKMKNAHEWTEQFSTRDFAYNVIPSAIGEIREVKKDGSTYVWTIEDLIRLFNEYMASGKSGWEEFVEQNREVLESVDPGGKLIGELIDARRPFGGEAYATLGERLDESDAQLAQIAKIPKNLVNDGVTDNLAKIQAALDLGGRILIPNAGTYMIDGCLLIGSNTTLELGEGVRIKQKTTENNMLKNRDVVNGNENITIKGGTWDYNYTKIANSEDRKKYHAIVLQNVKHVKLENVAVLNARKYGWLIGDCEFLTVSGLYFNTFSDGIHLMGPVNYADIKNLSGTTGDNLFAMTIGDYLHYEISKGNFTNIKVDGIYCENSREPVRLVGNPGYYFDNIVIQNIFGTITHGCVVAVIQDTDLVYTDVRNLTIKNIYAASVSSQVYINCMAGKNITIENVKGGLTNMPVVHVDQDAVVDHIQMTNIASPKDSVTSTIEIEGVVKSLSIKNLISEVLFNSGTALSVRGNIELLNLDGLYAKNGSNCISLVGDVNTFNIENAKVNNVESFINKTSLGNTLINISNSNLDYLGRFIKNTGLNALTRVVASGVSFSSDAKSRFEVLNGAKISLNGSDFRAKDVSTLTPIDGDMIWNTEPTFSKGTGLYVFNKGAWIKSNDFTPSRYYLYRDAALTGVQTINVDPYRTPKAILINAFVPNSKKSSTSNFAGGFYTVNSTGEVLGLSTMTDNSIVCVADTPSNRTFGKLQNIISGSFQINWTHTGTGGTGTVELAITVWYEG